MDKKEFMHKVINDYYKNKYEQRHDNMAEYIYDRQFKKSKTDRERGK